MLKLARLHPLPRAIRLLGKSLSSPVLTSPSFLVFPRPHKSASFSSSVRLPSVSLVVSLSPISCPSWLTPFLRLARPPCSLPCPVRPFVPCWERGTKIGYPYRGVGRGQTGSTTLSEDECLSKGEKTHRVHTQGAQRIEHKGWCVLLCFSVAVDSMHSRARARPESVGVDIRGGGGETEEDRTRDEDYDEGRRRLERERQDRV